MPPETPPGWDFGAFAEELWPRLVRALAPMLGAERAADAAAESVAWAWEHRDRVAHMGNPAGYLYRVAVSRSRLRPQGHLPSPRSIGVEGVEPQLVRALRTLTSRQQQAVWLVHACEWTYAEVAEALGMGVPTVGTHVARGMQKLRRELNVEQ